MGFCKDFWKIDKKLLPIKVHYFLFYAAASCVLPFRTVFAKQLGISATAVGVIFLAVPFVKTLMNPIFGCTVDYFKKFRIFISLTMVFFAVTHVAMLYVPPLHGTNEFKANYLQVRLQYCSDDALSSAFNISYLQVYSQLESLLHKDSVDISCKITCNSQFSPVGEISACVDNITLEAQLVLKGRPCYLEPSFPDGNVAIARNLTRQLVKVNESVLIFNQIFDENIKQNCSYSNLTYLENKIKSSKNYMSMKYALEQLTQKLNNTSWSNLDLNFSAVYNQSNALNTRGLFLVENDDYYLSCACTQWLSCKVKNCNGSSTQDLNSEPSSDFYSSTLWLLFTLVATSSVCYAAVSFVVDTVCYEILDNKEEYGKQRLCGTIGWGLGAFVGDYLNQITSTDNSTTDYSVSFYLNAFLIIIGLIPVSRMKVENVKYSSNICRDLCSLLYNRNLVINLIMICTIGIVSGLLFNYQFWFMKEIGSTQMLLGLSQIVECWLAELPCFLVSGWVIRKIGYSNCNSLALLCHGLRCLFLSYMQNPWMTLPLALTSGPTYGIFFVSMTMYGKTEAPPGTEATVQSILAVAFEGLGCGIGSILGGIGFDAFGSRKTFFYTGIACFILLAANVLIFFSSSFYLHEKELELIAFYQNQLENMVQQQVDKNLLPVKVHYFLINGAHSGVLPFISVYAKQMKITADAMGYIYAFLCCFTVITRPFFGGIVDHFQKLKLVLVTLIFIDIAADMGLNFIPSPSLTEETSIQTSLLCLNGKSYLLQLKNVSFPSNDFACTEETVISCTLCKEDTSSCINVKNQTNIKENEYISLMNSHWNIPSNCTRSLFAKCTDIERTFCRHGDYFNSSDVSTSMENPPLQLWMLSVFTAVMYICIGSITSLSDAACFNTLGSKPYLYGRQRMWGTIGWGTFALLVGYLNQVFTGTSSIYNYSAGFYMLIVLFLLDMLVIPKLQLKKVTISKNICKDVGRLVARPRVILFMLQVFFVGVFIGMGRSYLFWYLRTLDASQLVLGSVSAVQCFLGELPFFFFAGWIITKLGHVNTFTMSFVAHGIKYLGYSFLSNPWWCLPIEILQGPCFGSFYSAMASYAKIIAPEGTEATVQGLASGTFEGLGVAVGSLLGGYGFSNFGGRSTFFYTGIISIAIGILNCAINTIMACKNTNSV